MLGVVGGPKASLTQLPIERINAVLRPTGAQKNALDHLSAATEKSVRVLQKACPHEVPLTPVGRLQAMDKRLSAMLEAANLVQPPLNDFYASLGSEQKARFNVLPLSQARPYAAATQPAYASAPTYSATTINRGAFRSVTDCLNAASAAHVPLYRCS